MRFNKYISIYAEYQDSSFIKNLIEYCNLHNYELHNLEIYPTHEQRSGFATFYVRVQNPIMRQTVLTDIRGLSNSLIIEEIRWIIRISDIFRFGLPAFTDSQIVLIKISAYQKKRFTKPVIIKPFPRKSLLFYNINFRLLFWTVSVHAACRCTIYVAIRIRHCSSQRPVPSVRAWHVQSYLFHTFQQNCLYW